MEEGEINSGRSVCWSCGASVPRDDNYCGKCGQGLGRSVHWYYRHAGAVFLSLAAGPFALYFVWRSPVLSRGAKWGYTAAVFAITWFAVNAVLDLWMFMRDAASGLQF